MGASGSNIGVSGSSQSGIGVSGTSQTSDAINGTSSSPQRAGVSANNNGGGFGLWAKTTGAQPASGGIAGYFSSDGNNAIQAIGTGENADAILAQSSSSKHAAVSAQNTNGGFGLWANSPTGTAIYGQGKLAGHFQGDVQANGKLTVSVDVVLTGADFA